MENQRRQGGFKRLFSKLKVHETPPPATTATASQNNQSRALQVVNRDYNDQQWTQNRYKNAVNRLKEANKTCKGTWSSFDFNEFNDESEEFDDSQFKNKINEILTLRESSIKDKEGWSRFTYAVECVFTALSLFSKNFLTVAQNAQSVNATLVLLFLLYRYLCWIHMV
jgi:hypothetical protein